MILGNSMQMFEDILYEEEERVIKGFINSSGDLEYSIYKCIDGGFIDLEDRDYNKEELSSLLEIELEDFIHRNISTLHILGHDIVVKLSNGKHVLRADMDDEVYEISHDIMQGSDCGDILIESKKEKAYWNIVP